MYIDYVAIEDIQNHSICVVEDINKVRKMKYFEDINKPLIYVDNITLDGENISIVKEGDMIRGFRIVVVRPFER